MIRCFHFGLLYLFQQITLKEFYLKIYPKKLFTFRVCPSTKVSECRHIFILDFDQTHLDISQLNIEFLSDLSKLITSLITLGWVIIFLYELNFDASEVNILVAGSYHK